MSDMIQRSCFKTTSQPLHPTALTSDLCRAETSSTTTCNSVQPSARSPKSTQSQRLRYFSCEREAEGEQTPPPPQLQVPTWLNADSQNVLDTLSQTREREIRKVDTQTEIISLLVITDSTCQGPCVNLLDRETMIHFAGSLTAFR